MDIHSAWISAGVLSEEALERSRKAHARFIEVFGDDDWRPSWFLKRDGSLGHGKSGIPMSPSDLAASSEEGLQRVMAMLDELAKTETPKWKPKIQGQKRSSRHRSRR